MIKIDKTNVVGWEAAIRGMRNPMNSWDKSDSGLRLMNENDVEFGYEPNYEYIIGKDDIKLMLSLAKAGHSHSKYRRMINVTCDITAPLYWWKEYDTYKVGTVANSTSTMHKITSKRIELSDFSIDDFGEMSSGSEGIGLSLIDFFCNVVADCEFLREQYIATKDKRYWKGLIQLLPTSYNQLRTVQFNYEVLANMYHDRKNHKLDEWRELCNWIRSLPYSEIITEEQEHEK